MFPLHLPEDNIKNTSGFLGFSEGVEWENLQEMGQSLTCSMECRSFLVDVFGQRKQICRFPVDLCGFS